jgi:hypothetical protein
MSDPLREIVYPGDSGLGSDLTLLPISPQRVLATWSVPNGLEPSGESLGASHGSVNTADGAYRLRLREVVVDPTDGEAVGREWVIDVEDGRKNCVVDVTEPGIQLRAELVRANGINGSARVAQSRRVQMPPATRQEDAGRIQWMICDRPDPRHEE